MVFRTKNGTNVARPEKKITARFFKADSGNEPAREWIKGLSAGDKKAIGEDIKTAELGWPVGMPTCRKVQGDIWEVRTDLGKSRIARVLFAVEGQVMLLLHGFIKKTQTTPDHAIKLAQKRLRTHRHEQ